MLKQSVETQARIYVYDLNNCAKEYGFKADEGWELNLTSDAGKTAIEKVYYPTISAKVLPEILSELCGLVKTKLPLPKIDLEKKADANSISAANHNLQYLVAFNPKRMR